MINLIDAASVRAKIIRMSRTSFGKWISDMRRWLEMTEAGQPALLRLRSRELTIGDIPSRIVAPAHEKNETLQ